MAYTEYVTMRRRWIGHEGRRVGRVATGAALAAAVLLVASPLGQICGHPCASPAVSEPHCEHEDEGPVSSFEPAECRHCVLAAHEEDLLPRLASGPEHNPQTGTTAGVHSRNHGLGARQTGRSPTLSPFTRPVVRPLRI